MLDAIQSISGAMERRFKAMCDVMMEILRQWLEFVKREVEEEKVAACCGYRRIGGCFLLAMRGNSFTRHAGNRTRKTIPALRPGTSSYFWYKCPTSDPSSYNWQYIPVPHRMASWNDGPSDVPCFALDWATSLEPLTPKLFTHNATGHVPLNHTIDR